MMDIIPYFVTDENDVIIKTGTTQRLHLESNATLGNLHLGAAPHGSFKFIEGEFIPFEPPVSYSEARRLAYPQVDEQMDMLWHAMDSGDLPRSEPFYSSIKAVKTEYPKPD